MHIIDLLLSSTQKLSYLAIKGVTLGILDSEVGEMFEGGETGYFSNIRNLECHSTMEQLQKYNPRQDIFSYHIAFKMKMYFMSNHETGIIFRLKNVWEQALSISRRLFPRKAQFTYTKQICVVPLPYFNTYNILLEDNSQDNADATKILGLFKRNQTYKKNSAFIDIISRLDNNNIFRQGDTVLEVMLQYKWRKFVRARFIGVFFIHIAYYISYCTGVLFAYEMYGYDSTDSKRLVSAHPQHMASIIVAFLSGLVLLGQEIHQIIKSKSLTRYIKSGYNWVDLAAFVFPLVTFFQLILNMKYFVSLNIFMLIHKYT